MRDDTASRARPRPHARFRLGRSRSGRWILQDTEGLGYAIFATYDAAINYALEETGGARDAIIPCPGGLECGFGCGSN